MGHFGQVSWLEKVRRQAMAVERVAEPQLLQLTPLLFDMENVKCIWSVLCKVLCTPSLQDRFLIFPFLWIAIPESFLYGNSGATTDNKKLGTEEEFDFLSVSG